MIRSEKSAEAVAGDASRRRAERVEQPRDVPLGAARHQKPGQPGRAGARDGEAGPEAASDEAALARHAQTSWEADDLLGQALARENVGRAWKLDEVDRELERRGHRFVRYADDCNVYVRSQRAGERVLEALRGCYGRLALKVNELKTAVGPVRGRKFLGYSIHATKLGTVHCLVAEAALERLRERLRAMTRRQRRRSLEQVAEELRVFIPGWKACFRLASSKRARRDLDSWLRHRLRALQLKQWRRGSTIYRELRRLGAAPSVARSVAANSRRWWHNSAQAFHRVRSTSYFDRLGVPHFS